MTRLILILISILFIACRSYNVPIRLDQMETPPGLVKMTANYFVDKTEITNSSYREFTNWVGKNYGYESKEYKEVEPDTVMWNNLSNEKGYIPYLLYISHPAYKEHPVVCIKYEQAKKYSKWRSDRVMEFILIREGIIRYKPVCPVDSVFTIDRYFSGQYYNIKPYPYLLYYPEYSLPDTSGYRKLISFADSLFLKRRKKCRKEGFCNSELFTVNCKENKNLYFSTDLLRKTTCYLCKENLIIHLKGNVTELTSSPGIGFGGSFKDSCALIEKQLFFRIGNPDNNIGFRNVCTWRKWANN